MFGSQIRGIGRAEIGNCWVADSVLFDAPMTLTS